MKFGRCIESYVVTVYAVNDTGTIYNALRKFGTLEFVRCMGENVVNGVRSNEVRLNLVFNTLTELYVKIICTLECNEKWLHS